MKARMPTAAEMSYAPHHFTLGWQAPLERTE